MIQELRSGSKALRDAATLLVLRDAPAGMEVLMLTRTERALDPYAGNHVFPGGVVEDNDRGLYAFCAGLDDGTASRRLGLEANGLAYYVAAIRECFEEAGLLFAYGPDGALVDLDGVDAVQLADMRRQLASGEINLGDICARLKLRLAVDRLAYLSHWLTPLDIAKRFDTRFFVAIAPPTQTALHDGGETLCHFWTRPSDVLARVDESKLMRPTRHNLLAIAAFASARDCHQHALAQPRVELVMPRRALGSAGPRVLLPDEPAYAEVARLDPEGHGGSLYEIQPGKPVRLSPRLIRITAPNGNMMTGPGTNTYLVGGGKHNEWAVIDPGPNIATHVRDIIAAAPGPIRWIFVTHTHGDHSPAALPLKSLTGALLHGQPAPDQEWQDHTFQPDTAIVHGDRFAIGDGATLRAVHTPGHTSNHVCYLLEEEQTLFTGDHIMQGSTVVITPPDGDMAAYLDSLRALLQGSMEWLAPGHGHLMNQPHRMIQKLIEHRLMRERKVIAALRELGSVELDSLLRRVYDDVPTERHPMAKHSLMAHLIKLANDELVLERNGQWRLC